MPSNTQNWGSVGIGIATFARVLAAATAAGIFAVTTTQNNYPEWTRITLASLVSISLVAYLAVLLSGMAALFRQTLAAQRAVIAGSASAAFVQVYSAVLAAILLILFPLLGKIS